MICYSELRHASFITYFPYQTISLPVTRRWFYKQLWLGDRWPRGRLSVSRYWSRLSLFSLWDIWSLSCPNSKTFRCLFLSQAITPAICGSGVSSKCFFTGVDSPILPCIDSWTNGIQWSKILNLTSTRIIQKTRLECFSQICAKTSLLQSFLLTDWVEI